LNTAATHIPVFQTYGRNKAKRHDGICGRPIKCTAVCIIYTLIFTPIRCIVCSLTDISTTHFIISSVPFHSKLNELCNLYIFLNLLLFQVKFWLCYSNKIEETDRQTDTLVSVNTIYVCHDVHESLHPVTIMKVTNKLQQYRLIYYS
jgi:dipeptide/tripeptide permease